MIKDYVKTAWRNLGKRKLFSFINIVGLALGLAFAGIIGIYVYENLQVDRTQPANLYRVITAYNSKTESNRTSGVGRALIPAIRQEIPEAEYVVPVKPFRAASIKTKNEHFYDRTILAGEHFFQAFNFPLLKGNPVTVLKEPNAAVLTETAAKKYFGTADAVGKILYINDTLAFTVTGVAKDFSSSHINWNILLSFSTFEGKAFDMSQWFVWDMTCYVTLKKNVNVKDAESKIAALPMAKNGEEYRSFGHKVKQELEPVRNIYLFSPLPGLYMPKGNPKELYIFSGIGIALLLLACINFINLTTAYQSDRGKEVGVRKTMGASTGSLVGQFMAETLVIVLIASLLATGIIAVLLPFVERISEMKLSLSVLMQPVIIAGAIALIMITTLLAGMYPSSVLAKLQPTESMKGLKRMGKGNFRLRRILVVFQFVVSLILVMGTLVAMRQLRFMQEKDLGFNKEEIIVLDISKLPKKYLVDNYESIKNQLQEYPGIKSISGSMGMPGRFGWDGQTVIPEGFTQEQSLTMEVIPSDQDYTKTLGITLKAGRDFSKAFSTDATNGVLLNEEACRTIGWTPAEAIGKRISSSGSGLDSGSVIGVMADYHQHGLQMKINPIVIFNGNKYTYNFFAVKLQTKNVQEAVNNFEKFWKTKFPGYTLEWFALDDDLNRQYKSEANLASVVKLFALLTIFIAALGLLGITLFTVLQRTKEIGIRKVLGAKLLDIITLVGKEFLLLVIVALLIAVPLAWWAMNDWLQNFSYRTSINSWLFVITGAGALLLTFAIVGVITMRAALVNPVRSLRSE
ncbi:MAG: ABC transporter permease [Niabella sp.]|nr:ABC transporter permease [Niabella sp.]